MSCLPGQQGAQGVGGRRLFERPPIFGYDLNVESIASDWTGGDISTAWTKMKLVTSYTVQNDIGLTGLVLATAIVNPVADKIVGVFVIIGDATPTLEINKGQKVPMVHLTWQNSPSGGGTPNPTNKTSSLNFGENAAMRLNSGQKISIYSSADNVAQKFAAVLTIYTISLDKK